MFTKFFLMCLVALVLFAAPLVTCETNQIQEMQEKICNKCQEVLERISSCADTEGFLDNMVTDCRNDHQEYDCIQRTMRLARNFKAGLWHSACVDARRCEKYGRK